jgi:hypothetical protein
MQMSNRDGKQEEEEEECAVLVRAKSVRGQGLGFGGRVALMEDGMAYPTHAREAYSSTGKVARLPFGASLAPTTRQLAIHWKK